MKLTKNKLTFEEITVVFVCFWTIVFFCCTGTMQFMAPEVIDHGIRGYSYPVNATLVVYSDLRLRLSCRRLILTHDFSTSAMHISLWIIESTRLLG